MNIGNIEEAYAQGVDEATEAVAGDPSAWYVRDKNGEKVHIGDIVRTHEGIMHIVTGLDADGVHFISGYAGTNTFEKAVPDSREKIIDELALALASYPDKAVFDYEPMAIAFYDRIKAVEA